MDEERRRKIEAGRKKLDTYKKRKTTEKQSESDHSSFSDTSLSLSPLPLSDSNKKVDTESISEKIECTTNSDNSENDRSLHEITIGNIFANEPNSGDNSVISLNALEKFVAEKSDDNFPGNDFIHKDSVLGELLSEHEFESQKSEKSDPINKNYVLDSILSENPFESKISKNSNESQRSETMKSSDFTPPPKSIDLDNKIKTHPEIIRQHSDETLQSIDTLDKSELEDKKRSDDLNEVFESRKSMEGSNPSTNTFSLETSTDYKPYDKNYGMVEFHDVLVLREKKIKQLTDALQLVLQERTELQDQIVSSVQEIAELKEELVKMTTVIKRNNLNSSLSNNESLIKSTFDFDDSEELNKKLTPEEQKIVTNLHLKLNAYVQQKVKLELDALKNQTEQVEIENTFNETFSTDELSLISDLRQKIFKFIQQNVEECKNVYGSELRLIQQKFEAEKIEHKIELDKLRALLSSVKSGSVEITELRNELNEKHGKEMEELRMYFEQKCADLEKHYSDEVISQHSRKLSGSSVCSEMESEIYPIPGPGGDGTTKESLNTIRSELQNKYHAELEILRDDYENRLDEMRIEQETITEDFKRQNNVLKIDLEEARRGMVAVQEVASSGDFEIAEVVESYERRLQEQVLLAKDDIINALEQQIQTLVSSPKDNVEWPSELLQLRDRLTQHWNTEIQELKQKHEEEMNRLKEEQEKHLQRAVERERRNSLKNGDELEMRKERDNLKKVAMNLRYLVAELIKYFTQCEDELNNTLVEELLKYGFDKDDNNLNDTSQSSSDLADGLSPRVKRVHFAPDVSNIIDLINDSSGDVNDFRSELDSCLKRLKEEANAILNLTSNLKQTTPDQKLDMATPDDDKVSSLTRQLIAETQTKSVLSQQYEETRQYVESLEAEKHSLETQLELMVAKQQVLVRELDGAKVKISQLIESGRKEIVSEGYGESEIMGSTTLDKRISSLTELQERVHTILAESNPPVSTALYQVVEELCREYDRIMNDAKKVRDDLTQQIEAAHKKLCATTKFLEEQAMERDWERDEALKEIATLKEQLRSGERTRASCERIHNEDTHKLTLNACRCGFHNRFMESVEQLEAQMREMTLLMAECESKKNEVENELKEAIDKIWVLRDIIRDLESQIEDKTKTEVELKNIIQQLEDKIRLEAKHCEELWRQIETLQKNPTETEVIRRLEAEIQKLMVSSELVGPDGVLKQVKQQLNDIEKTLEKRTKDLEALHIVVSNTNCSSPSEDMSIRDQIRPAAKNDTDTSDLPLEQLARLKEKLIRHARAEDAATKRIRDLEMQVFTAKQEYNEMQSERDVLQDQLSEQLVLISSLQLRLDDQRLRAEDAQNQTNTSLEHKIYELESEIQELKETIHSRDKNIKQLNTIVEQTKRRLAEQQKQLNTASDLEKEIVEQLQEEIKQVKLENEKLKTNLQIGNNSKVLNSEFYDTMISDKNAEIDRLKTKLNETERQLGYYLSMNLTKDSSPKSGDICSLIGSSDLTDPPRRRDVSFDSSITSGEHIQFKRNPNVNEPIGLIGSTFRDSKQDCPLIPMPELSSIEAPSITVAECHLKQGDSIPTPVLKDGKRVRFEESIELQNELAFTKTELENLCKKLEFSESKSEEFKTEIEGLKTAEKNMRVEFAEAKMCIQQKSNKIEFLEKECERKDEMYLNLAKEKRNFEHRIGELEQKCLESKDSENLISAKNKEIYELEQQLVEIGDKERELENLKQKFSILEHKLEQKIEELNTIRSDFDQIKSELSNKNDLLLKNEKEHNNLLSQFGDFESNISKLKQTLNEKTEIIKQLTQQQNRGDFELEISKNRKDLAERDLQLIRNKDEIQRLTNEVLHLQEFLNEKDKIINQMTVDSGSLHASLEAIQFKLQESGNVVDLKRKLRDEQNLTNILREELNYLKQNIPESSNITETLTLLKESLEREKRMNDELKSTKESLQLESLQLKESLDLEIEKVRQLQQELDEEKLNSNLIQLQDANIIETMRLKLETLLDNENETEKQLKNENQAREQLEKQLYKRSESLSLDSSLKKESNFELTCLKMDLVKITTENEVLKSELNTINNLHALLQSELKQTKQLNESQRNELKKLKLKLQNVKEGNKEDGKEERINNKQLILELEEERNQMKKCVEELSNNVRKLHEREKELKQLLLLEQQKQMNEEVPERFLNKIKELTALLQEHIADNKQMSNTLSHLTDERKLLQHKVKDLEERLHVKTPFDDPAARADHLFGRYLKSESYRKALIFQKRYLLTLLASYQQCSSRNVGELNFVVSSTSTSTAKPLNRFRSAVYAVISITRMRYIVQRWHTGKRIGGAVILKRPVLPTASATLDKRPWSGNSPPCKDRNGTRTELPLGTTIQESIILEPLQAPALLSQYIDRFDHIQQRLGLAMDRAAI